MKEAYFTGGTLTTLAQDMLSECLEVRRRDDLQFSPARSALLVLDMQDFFLLECAHAYIPSSPAIIPGITALITAFYRCRRPVFFTKHINTSGNASQMKSWWRDLIHPDAVLSEISTSLDTSGGRVVQKHQYDAFYQTPLEDLLRSNRVAQVVICGVMTHLCCETTARSAFMRGFDCFFCIDGTASYNERFHRASLVNLAHGFAFPVLIQEILAKVGDQNDA